MILFGKKKTFRNTKGECYPVSTNLALQSQPWSSEEAVHSLMYDITFRWLGGILLSVWKYVEEGPARDWRACSAGEHACVLSEDLNHIVRSQNPHSGNHTSRGSSTPFWSGALRILATQTCRQNSHSHKKIKKVKTENSSLNSHWVLCLQITSQTPTAVVQHASTYMLL